MKSSDSYKYKESVSNPSALNPIHQVNGFNSFVKTPTSLYLLIDTYLEIMEYLFYRTLESFVEKARIWEIKKKWNV